MRMVEAEMIWAEQRSRQCVMVRRDSGGASSTRNQEEVLETVIENVRVTDPVSIRHYMANKKILSVVLSLQWSLVIVQEEGICLH